jgi:hypothetical protein
VKDKSNARGESQVTLGGNEMESEVMEVNPLWVKLVSEGWLGNDSQRWSMIAKCLSICGGKLYLPETRENTRYKSNNLTKKQVKLVVLISSSMQ